MRKVKVINEKGIEVNLSTAAPFILQMFEESTGINVYNSKSMNQDGSTYLGNTLTPKDIKMQITILADSRLELENRKQKLREVFNPQLGESTLIYDNGLRKRKVNYIATELPFFRNQRNIEDVCLINLLVHDPYWKDLMETKSDIAIWKPNLVFPLIIPEDTGLSMGYREPSLIANILNQGDVKTGMRIQFRALATLENPSLFNINTREYFKINTTMLAGDIIEVTTEFQNKRVKLIRNGVITTLSEWDYTSTWLQLYVGDNLFRYDATSGLENLEVSIYYTQKYLGV